MRVWQAVCFGLIKVDHKADGRLDRLCIQQPNAARLDQSPDRCGRAGAECSLINAQLRPIIRNQLRTKCHQL